MTLAFVVVLISSLAYGQTIFKDVTAEAGIQHEFQVYEGMFGGGACVFDFNKDGFEDLFITGGTNNDRLYLNKGNGTFQDIYKTSGWLLRRTMSPREPSAQTLTRMDGPICSLRQ